LAAEQSSSAATADAASGKPGALVTGNAEDEIRFRGPAKLPIDFAADNSTRTGQDMKQAA
jgi:hypothetical protein